MNNTELFLTCAFTHLDTILARYERRTADAEWREAVRAEYSDLFLRYEPTRF